MASNLCLACRFSNVKINIQIPEKYNQKLLAEETKKFASTITTQTQHKRLHYQLTFNPKQKASPAFSVDYTCVFNVKPTDCSKYNHARNCRIRHLEAAQTC